MLWWITQLSKESLWQKHQGFETDCSSDLSSKAELDGRWQQRHCQNLFVGSRNSDYDCQLQINKIARAKGGPPNFYCIYPHNLERAHRGYNFRKRPCKCLWHPRRVQLDWWHRKRCTQADNRNLLYQSLTLQNPRERWSPWHQANFQPSILLQHS
jgi:hypothetical protein